MSLGATPLTGLPPLGALNEEDSNAELDPYAAVFSNPDQDLIFLAELDVQPIN